MAFFSSLPALLVAVVAAVLPSLLLSGSVLVRAHRVPGSPFPVCPSAGLNASSVLYLFNVNSGSRDDFYTVSVLQGILSKTRPRIFRTSVGPGHAVWLEELRRIHGVRVNATFEEGGAAGLVRLFASELRGYALVNLTDGESPNAAATVAALTNILPVTAANEHLASGAGLPLLYDLRGVDLETAIATVTEANVTAGSAAATAAAAGGGFRFSRGMTTVQSPSLNGFTEDLAVACGMQQWWPKRADFLGPDGVLGGMRGARAHSILGGMDPPFLAFGNGPGPLPSDNMDAIGLRGGAIITTLFSANLDVLSSFDLPQLRQHRPPPTPTPSPAAPAPKQQHTITFGLSSGCDTNFVLFDFATERRWYASPARGTLPMGFSTSPILADLAPAALHFFFRTASRGGDNGTTDNRDVFFADVSGVGLFHADRVGPNASDHLASLASLTAGYMAKADLRIVSLAGHGPGYANATVEAYLVHDQIDAIVWHEYGDFGPVGGQVVFFNGKPVIRPRFSLWGTAEVPGPDFSYIKNTTGLVHALLAQARDPTSEAGYSFINVHAWTNSVEDCKAVVDALNASAPGAFLVVPPDDFFRRMVASVPHPPPSPSRTPTPSPTPSATSSQTVSSTATPSASATATQTRSSVTTPSTTATATQTRSSAATSSATATATQTRSSAATSSATATATQSATATASASASLSRASTPSSTMPRLLSASQSGSPPSPRPSATPLSSPVLSSSKSVTPSPSQEASVGPRGPQWVPVTVGIPAGNPALLAEDVVFLCLLRGALSSVGGVAPSSVMLVAVAVPSAGARFLIPASALPARNSSGCPISRRRLWSRSAARELPGTPSSPSSLVRAEIEAAVDVSQSSSSLQPTTPSSDPAGALLSAVQAALGSPATVAALFGPVLSASCVAQGIPSADCPNASAVSVAVAQAGGAGPAQPTGDSASDAGPSSGLVVGAVLGSVVLMAALAGLAVWVVRGDAAGKAEAPTPSAAVPVDGAGPDAASSPPPRGAAPQPSSSDGAGKDVGVEVRAEPEAGGLFEQRNPLHREGDGGRQRSAREAFGPVARGRR